MGTTWSAQIVAAAPGLDAAFKAVLAEVVAALSQWAPDSALSRFNRAPVGEWQDVPDMLAEVLGAGLAIHAASVGAFDPAAGIPADLWGFGASGPRRGLPNEVDVAAALARSGADGVELDGTRARRVRDVAIDLSGIGKGHAVDLLAQAARAEGCEDFLIEIGGEYAGAGIRPDGQPWWVDLENPPSMQLSPMRIAAHDIAIATSGDYRRFVLDGEGRLGHTLDPRTGWPIENGVVSVSVIAADCMTADAWATALTVLGPEHGLAAADREGLVARIVTRDGEERLSPALAAMLED